MPPKSAKIKLLIALALMVFFIPGGYLLSDDFFFNNLIRENRITTPEEAFAFVEGNTYRPPEGMDLAVLTTPREMLTRQKYLYCDQGAMVLATLVSELGYETRLVDLVGDDDISRHTILEVNQNGTWKTYDTLQNLQGVTYERSAKSLNADYYTRRVEPVYRPYPRLYNRVIQNNFYLKHLALLVRSKAG
jgi:hypothetical protein